MTCQGPVTQLYIRKEVRAGSQGNVQGPLQTVQQAAKGKPTLISRPKLCLEFTRSFSAHLTLQIEHVLWIPSLPRTGLELPKWSGPKNKMGNHKAKCTK